MNESSGVICAGNGGDLLGSAAGIAGMGGQTTVRGNVGGAGSLTNQGTICSGEGGHANLAATESQQGGAGGRLILIARPELFLRNGLHQAGVGGTGSQSGHKGRDGAIWIDPTGNIHLGGANVRGGAITISGGYSWTLDLSQMDGALIAATEGITLAVGAGGEVDLRGNEQVILQAEEEVVIFSDLIHSDGVLTEVISASMVMTESSKILQNVSIGAPTLVSDSPGETISVEIEIFNNGPVEDSYELTLSQSADWSLGSLPETITVEGLGSSSDNQEPLLLTITFPPEALDGAQNSIMITALSQSDPDIRETRVIEAVVDKPTLYLPLVNR